MKTRAFAFLPVLIGVVVVGIAGLFVARPKILHGDSQRAAASTEATSQVVATVNKQGAEAAASIAVIAEANASAPASLERDFIAREAPVALAKLPAPDPAALLEAERRKVAILEGKNAEAEKLYAVALNRAAELQKQKDAAIAQRQAVDLKLEQTAAERLGESRQFNRMALALALLCGLFLYVKITHLSPGAVAELATDLKAGKHPLDALDGVTSRMQQRFVRLLAKLK